MKLRRQRSDGGRSDRSSIFMSFDSFWLLLALEMSVNQNDFLIRNKLRIGRFFVRLSKDNDEIILESTI
jgi:hypothetical protein